MISVESKTSVRNLAHMTVIIFHKTCTQNMHAKHAAAHGVIHTSVDGEPKKIFTNTCFFVKFDDYHVWNVFQIQWQSTDWKNHTVLPRHDRKITFNKWFLKHQKNRDPYFVLSWFTNRQSFHTIISIVSFYPTLPLIHDLEFALRYSWDSKKYFSFFLE